MDDQQQTGVSTQKWKHRALKAEQLLETITNRVGEVRAAFSKKIEELEVEKREVEDSYEESQAQISKMEAALAERDATIARLCKEVAEEKRLRQLDAEGVGERAEQIRTWVSTKVSQLEEENKRLQSALRHAVMASKGSVSSDDGYDQVRQSFHDYEEPPPLSLLGDHDYEEPDDEFKRRFFSSPPPPSDPQPIPPRRHGNPTPPKVPPKLIVSALVPVAAPDFRAAEPGRPARPPTPDLSLLSPRGSPLSRAAKFVFPHFEQLKKSRSESDLLDDSGMLSPLSGSKHKLSEPEIAKLSARPARKPRPLPRRSARDLLGSRKISSPPTVEDVARQRPQVVPRRRAVTDGDLLAGDVVRREDGALYGKSRRDCENPYARVHRRRTSASKTASDASPPGADLPVRPRSNNIYYQLETPVDGEGTDVGTAGEEVAEIPEIRSRNPLPLASTSSDASSPPSPEFLQPLSSFTSVNTLPRAGDTWTRESVALQHDYSNIDVRNTDVDVECVFSDSGEVILTENGSLMPVSSSDSALGTLDKTTTNGDGLLPTSPPPVVQAPNPHQFKPQRKAPPPPVPPKKKAKVNGLTVVPASVPVLSHLLHGDELDDAPLFETVPRGNSVGVRPSKKHAVPNYVNDGEFLASSEDEKEDVRQGGITMCENALYSNTKFEHAHNMMSASAPHSNSPLMADLEIKAKRNRIQDLAKQHKLHRSFHSESSFADALVSNSPPTGRARNQPKVRSDGSVDEPRLEKADLEYQGYLTKQESKGKVWKRRWFALQHGELIYYKLKDDYGKRKPQGRLPLAELQAVSHDKDLTLQITTSSKVYFLTAESSFEADAWLKVFQNILRTSVSKQANEKVPTLLRPDCQGWVTRIQNGRAKRCWAVLMRQMLLFYLKQDLSEAQFADLCLDKSSIAVGSNTSSEEVTRFRSQLNPPPPEKFTITLFSSDADSEQAQTSLTVSGKDEKARWLYYLTVACKGFDETDTEKVVSMLMDNQHKMLSDFEGDSRVWWNHPVLSHSKKAITQPLTTLPSEELVEKAITVMKNIQLFCEVKVEQKGIDYHVAHVMTLLKDIFSQPGLCDEVYCQLIRQSSNHPLPSGFEVLQCWRLLIIIISCALPKAAKFHWYLQRHIQHHLDYSGSVAVLAAACQRLLQRVQENGPRALLPCRLEIHCLLLGDMSQIRPILLPVEMMDGSRYAVECDAVSLVQEVTDHLSQRLGLRDTLWSGFALHASRPTSSKPGEYLKPTTKICDAVRRVELEAMKDHRHGRLAPEKMWRLTFKNRLYFKGLSNQETDIEKRLLLFQIHSDVVKGYFPVNEEFAIDMMAQAMQVAQGPCPAGLNSHQRQGALTYGVTNYYPKKMLDACTKAEFQRLMQRLWVKWDGLRQKNRDACLLAYLRMVRRWPFCSASFFPCSIRGASSTPVVLAVQEDSISFLHADSLDLDHSYRYDQLLTFGGCEGDLMLVIQHTTKSVSNARHNAMSVAASTVGDTLEKGGTRKVLLQMKPTDVTAATLTIASYIKTAELQQDALEAAATALGL